jgi:hypothetical protein
MHKFDEGSLVKHVKTGNEYRIIEGPDTCRLESTNKPAYAYRDDAGILWVRDAEEMEDGRFQYIQ